MDATRPTWPAYILTVLVAGAGHAYLGKWRRGVSWLLIYLLALVFLSARSVTGAFDPSDPFVIEALQFESIDYMDVAVPLAVLIICLIDVYLTGLTIGDEAPGPEPGDVE